MNRPILIASSSHDEHAYKPVSEHIEKAGYPVIVYKTDKLLSGEDSFTFEANSCIDLNATYNGMSISPNDLSAAWYRKVGSFSLTDADTQISKQLHMNNEIRALHDTIWTLYPEDLWLSSPNNLRIADRKLGQLITAREVGFTTPETIVSSTWDDIESKLIGDDEEKKIIIKMMRGVISEDNKLKALHTTILDKKKIEVLRSYASSFPGLYQPYIEKAREWRVTVVGDNIFPVAIYTDETAKDDWRKLQMTDAVKFKTDNLPEGFDKKCIEYLSKMNLRYGAFDFVEKPDGEIVFLECNPNGQYSWLEELLGLSISSAIAGTLIKVAKARV